VNNFEGNLSSIRIDKWLWAVRIFKTRSLATTACNAGKVKINTDHIKPSKLIVAGDIITVQKEIIKHTYRVKEIIENRIAAKLVIHYCEDLTPEDELIKKKEFLKSSFYRPKGLGRPTKKERRDISKLREKG